MSNSKLKRGYCVIRAVNATVQKNSLDAEVRFDIIGTVINSKGTQLERVGDAFQPTW